MISGCLCCGYSDNYSVELLCKVLPPVIPSVFFNVQSDVFSKYGVPAGEEKHLSDIQECLLSDSMYVLMVPSIKSTSCFHAEKNTLPAERLDYLKHHIVSD